MRLEERPKAGLRWVILSPMACNEERRGRAGNGHDAVGKPKKREKELGKKVIIGGKSL